MQEGFGYDEKNKSFLSVFASKSLPLGGEGGAASPVTDEVETESDLRSYLLTSADTRGRVSLPVSLKKVSVLLKGRLISLCTPPQGEAF